jgi:hypothetical protein
MQAPEVVLSNIFIVSLAVGLIVLGFSDWGGGISPAAGF